MASTPLNLFIRASNSMVRFAAHFGALKEDELDIYDLEVRSEEIQKLWKSVEETFNNCLSQLENPEDLDMLYSKYEVSSKEFMRCSSYIKRLLSNIRSSDRSSLNSSTKNSVVSVTQHPDNILPGKPSVDASVNNLSSSSRTSCDVGMQTSSSTILNIGNTRISQSFVVDSPNVDYLHNLAIPPCSIEIFSGNIIDWPTFRDLFMGFILITPD